MDSELLPARVNDLANLCHKTSSPKFLGFLTPSETAAVKSQAQSMGRHNFYGGYLGAERTMLCFMPDWCDDPVYPITAFTFTYRNCDTLSHRDFLGALMALGITRETVGDILVEAGRAVVFVHSDVAGYVSSQINKIGNVGINMTQGYTEPLPSLGKKQQFTSSVASTRLDCVVAALCNASRSDAANRISEGLVSVNSVCCQKVTCTISDNDIVTIRQKGRFEIVSCDMHSKKGRIILKYNKYI